MKNIFKLGSTPEWEYDIYRTERRFDVTTRQHCFLAWVLKNRTNLLLEDEIDNIKDIVEHDKYSEEDKKLLNQLREHYNDDYMRIVKNPGANIKR